MPTTLTSTLSRPGFALGTFDADGGGVRRQTRRGADVRSASARARRSACARSAVRAASSFTMGACAAARSARSAAQRRAMAARETLGGGETHFQDGFAVRFERVQLHGADVGPLLVAGAAAEVLGLLVLQQNLRAACGARERHCFSECAHAALRVSRHTFSSSNSRLQ